MKEFVDMLIKKLEEYQENNTQCKSSDDYELGQFNACEYAIEIVNQLAEEYINDFCEWKKTDKRKSSPYHHALKHGNITLEFHDDFKFCPYCGKKIKIAPYQPKGE